MREHAVEVITEEPDHQQSTSAGYRVLYDGQCAEKHALRMAVWTASVPDRRGYEYVERANFIQKKLR